MIQYFWGQPGTQEALTANYDTLDSLIAQDRARLDVLEAGGTQTTWQPSQFETVAANRTAAAGDWLFVDASAAARTVTLPASPAVTDAPIWLSDAAFSWGTNPLTIARNGQLIEGASSDRVVNVDGVSLMLAFVGGSVGWRVIGYHSTSQLVLDTGSNGEHAFVVTRLGDLDQSLSTFINDSSLVMTYVQDEADATEHSWRFNLQSSNTGLRHYSFEENGVQKVLIDLLGRRLDIRDGFGLRIRNGTDTAWMNGFHDDVDFNFRFANTGVCNFQDVALLLSQGSLHLTEKAAPDAAVSGRGQIWARTDGVLFFTDDVDIDHPISEESGSFTVTVLHTSPQATGTIQWRRSGGLVTLFAPSGVGGTSNSILMELDGIPAAVRPANNRVIACVFSDNSEEVLGRIQMANSNSAGCTIPGGSFTASGTKGLPQGWSITYHLD